MQELSQHREDLGGLLKKIVDEGNTVLGETVKDNAPIIKQFFVKKGKNLRGAFFTDSPN